MVEIFAALGVNRTPRTSKQYEVGPLLNGSVHVRVELTKSGDPLGEGRVQLRFADEAAERTLLRAGSPSVLPFAGTPLVSEDVDGTASTVDSGLEQILANVTNQSYSTESLQSLIGSWGRAWLRIPLQDPKLKFAVCSPRSLYRGVFAHRTCSSSNALLASRAYAFRTSSFTNRTPFPFLLMDSSSQSRWRRSMKLSLPTGH